MAASQSLVSSTGAPDQQGGSRREAEALARAQQRVSQQRTILRPVGWTVISAAAVGAFFGHPAPSGHGKGLAVAVSLAAFAATLALAMRDGFQQRALAVRGALILVMGGAAGALLGLQPEGATALAGGATVWMAMTCLPTNVGVAVAVAATGGLDIAVAVTGGGVPVVLAVTLLCALFGLVARFLQQSRASQCQTELLLAQLEDARDEQLRGAAITERGRIAAELHDVLAHSLSGAAIQLQSARLLAEREGAGPRIRTAIDRASELVKDGLANAKQAVGALRGDGMPGVLQLPALVDSFRHDLDVDVTLRVEGAARTLPADAGLALYRGTQEALTNAARHARGAGAVVVLRYDTGRTSVCVENGCATPRPVAGADDGDLSRAGGGRGLAGLRERVESLGGRVTAGPTDAGWRVTVEVPA